MTTQTHEAQPDRQVSENIALTMHRARIKERQLAAAVGISQATLNRRVRGEQPWMLWEVQAIADFLSLTLQEITTDLPSYEEWRARRDSNPKPSVLEFGRPNLRLIVNTGLTANRIPGGPRPIPVPGARPGRLLAVTG